MTWVTDTLPAFSAWLPATDQAAATRALTLALATVETWLDRPLERLERTQEQFSDGPVILLRAWPVANLVSIVLEAGAAPPALDTVRLDKATGRISLGWYGWYGYAAITYVGGYATFPADLENALWSIAASLYPAMQSGTATGAWGNGAVSRVTTPDAGTIEFRSSSSGGSSADVILGGTLSPAIEAVLSRYRAQSVVGVG